MNLLRWLTFLLGSLTLTLTVLLFWFLYISSDASICSTMAFPTLGNSDHIVASVSIAPFHQIVFDYSCAD